MTLALDYGRRAERQRPEEPDVDPQVRFCERGRPGGRSLLDPGVRASNRSNVLAEPSTPGKVIPSNFTLKG
jgi:hypothetical protein